MASPLTAFEQRGHLAPWSSVAEEAAFIAALDAASPKVRVETWGYSVQGTPIRALVIGSGPDVVLHVGVQHANEPSTRDALLSAVRDWAFTEDADLLAYLRAATVVVIPTANPDSLAPYLRRNANDVDLNRDHVKLTQPETQAIHRAIAHYTPDVVLDWHESDGKPVSYTVGSTAATSVDASLHAHARALRDAMLTSVQAGGHTVATYQSVTGAEMLTGAAAAQGRVSVIIEAEMDLGDQSDAALRHERNRIAAEASWRWHAAHREAVRSTVREARQRTIRSTAPVTLHSVYSMTGPVIDPLPRAYIVTPEDWDALAVQRETFGLVGWPVANGVYVPTSQVVQTLAVYLLDAQSPERVVAGVPHGFPEPPVRIGRAYTLKFRTSGVTYNATLKVKA